jgi:hypothetical protein
MGKVYNLCRVKNDISAVLTVKSGLNMINELGDELNHGPCLWLWLASAISILFLLMWVLVYNYILVIRC